MEIKEISILNQLSLQKQMTFAYLCCERVFPYYEFFSRQNKFGNPQDLAETLDYLKRHLFVPVRNNQLEDFMDILNGNAPIENDLDTYSNGILLSICCVFFDCLEFYKDQTIAQLKQISNTCLDVTEFVLIDFEEETDSRSFEYQNHPMMKQETSFQKGIIKYLQKVDLLEPSDIHDLLVMQQMNTDLFTIERSDR